MDHALAMRGGQRHGRGYERLVAGIVLMEAALVAPVAQACAARE